MALRQLYRNLPYQSYIPPPFVHLVSKEHVSVKCLDNSLLMEETAIMCLNNVVDTVIL